ncbi:MAG: ABC transporter permease [Verrucomicrobia bacterium]|nr:ABC transporter permease [Verrucomicrobiota bacterium]
MTISETRSDGSSKKGARLLFQQLLRVREMTLLLLVGGCGILFSLTVPNFGSLGNFLSVADSLVFDAMITTGMTIALVSGGFDLSVGSVFASSGVVVAVAMVAGLSMWLSIVIALLTAAAWGFLNGFVITKIGVNPLLTTLATMGMARGFVYIITEGRVVTGFPDEFTAPGQAALGRVSVLVVIAALVIIVADVLLRKSAFLRQLYYIGSNERAARVSGINVERARIGVYLTTALLAGAAGILSTSKFSAAIPLMGTGAELKAIAAAVIGGASLYGGEGTVLGGALGLIFLALIQSVLVLLNISVYWQGFIAGAVLLVAVSLDVLIHRRS